MRNKWNTEYGKFVWDSRRDAVELTPEQERDITYMSRDLEDTMKWGRKLAALAILYPLEYMI